MADNGLEALTIEALAAQAAYERELLSQLRDWASAGLSVLKKERAFTSMQQSVEFVNGDQSGIKGKAISRVTDNKIKKIVLETVSALTDVRPIWNYETTVEMYKKQAIIMNKLARAWWRNGRVDRRLQSILTFACAGGSGYGALIWNHELPAGGDFELIPYDPRDVIPIGPVYSDSIQDWRGVMLRRRLPIEDVRKMYPSKAYKITKGSGSWFGAPHTYATKAFDLLSTMWSAMRGQEREGTTQLPDTTDLVFTYMKDDTILLGTEPREMGKGDFKYTVYPVGWQKDDGDIVTKEEARLYPRGRLIVCTADAILDDGPNPNWHGFFPVIRFTLDPMPWSLLGSSMVQDLIPLQQSLNETLRGIDDGIGQWIRRGIVADKNSISKGTLENMDSRKVGFKAWINPSIGEGFKLIDGPNLPNWYMEMLEFYKNEMDDNSGVRGLQQLSQLKQMPAADTVEQFMDALSPLLRLRGRSLETSLSELAEMLKVGFFQKYTMSRRVEMLGQDGITMEDFDYDPGSLTPAELPGATREDRTAKHVRNFSFAIAPNSFLNVSHATQKMLMLQLFRANGIDIYSLWESLDIPNIGPIPAENVPDRMIAARKLGLQVGPTPELVQVQTAAAVVQAQAAISQVQGAIAMGQMPLGTGGASPGMEGFRNNGVGSQGGRPPSGAELPEMVQKSGPEGPRMVMSESGR